MESPPEKRMRLQDANNHEQDEIMRLKEVVEKQGEILASKNKKLFEMEESNNKAEREKRKAVWEKMKIEREKKKVERENLIMEIEKMEVEDEKNKLEAKLRELVECPVCLTLPRAGPVPCCANGHFVCSPCLGKLREENKLEQV